MLKRRVFQLPRLVGDFFVVAVQFVCFWFPASYLLVYIKQDSELSGKDNSRLI